MASSMDESNRLPNELRAKTMVTFGRDNQVCQLHICFS